MSEKVGMERLVHEGMSDRKLGKNIATTQMNTV